MSPDRNAPCFCGSGKKFKKCHGSPQAQSSIRQDKFKLNRALAYKGALGKARAEFCADYALSKKASIAVVEEKLRAEAAAKGAAVTCSRGCIHCCHLFILATLQECEAIVYHLYQHDDLLAAFMDNFEEWRSDVNKIDACFRRLNSLHAKLAAGQATEAEGREYLEQEEVYKAAHIPCPFLIGGACSIYELRPYVCAGVMSISPPGQCSPAHHSHKERAYVKAELNMQEDAPYFVKPAQTPIFASMPFLVYRILENGWDVISSVPGLERLKEEAFADPLMRAAMRDVGVNVP
jgi:Fe-S-cluster containining protein